MLPVFLYREYPRCVVKRNIRLILQQSTQIVKVCVLTVGIVAENAENAVPLINNKDKRDFFSVVNSHQHFVRGVVLGKLHVGKLGFQLADYFFVEQAYQSVDVLGL